MPDQVWTAWHGHPSVVAGLVVLTGGYLLAAGPLRKRFGWAPQVPAGQVSTFLCGVLVLFFALLSPLHELGDKYLFSAHMVQHMLLTLAAPPLLIAGTPAWMLRPLVISPRVFRIVRTATLPVASFVVFNAVFVLWHIPALYDLALRERGVHILEHLMFLTAAILMWWPILGRLPELPRPSYLVQMLYLFVHPTVPAVLGAIITFSDGVLYEWYAVAPRIWGLSAHTDQQIGGIIMWIPGGLVYLLTLVVVFLIWSGQEGSPEERSYDRRVYRGSG